MYGIFRRDNRPEPLAHWGVARRKVGADVYPTWQKKLLGVQGPPFLQGNDIEPFETSHELSDALAKR